MSSSVQFLKPSEAAKQLGVSAKALRLYEQRGLLAPTRTEAGWRTYGPDELARAAEIAALRQLGLSLSQVARAIGENAQGLEPTLAAHQATLKSQIRQRAGTVERVSRLRANLKTAQALAAGKPTQLPKPATKPIVVFNLPWPWGGERFELRDIRQLNYIIGPLGSGKTRFAKCLAEAQSGAAFLGLERLADSGAAARAQLNADPVLKSTVDQALNCLVEDGATVSNALIALITGLETQGPAILVIDMLEQELDKTTQEALIDYLRRRGPHSRPLFFLTRSNAILDLEAVGPDEAIILCPANHSPPTRVTPYYGAPGYDSVATCLASPEVRSRTQGVIAWRPEVA